MRFIVGSVASTFRSAWGNAVETVALISMVVLSALPASAIADHFTVVKVTNLNDRGSGSLRDCVARSFPRVCMFEISGQIRLASVLEITKPDLVIAGQTAPSPGITLTNAGVIVKTHDVRIEHIAVRPGDDRSGPAPDQRDAISAWSPAARVTFKNVSASWATDENFSTYQGVREIVVSDCLIAEGLDYSIHPKGHHSMGALVGEGARGITFIGNLFAANNDRNIRWKFDTEGEMINNVIYGWGGSSSWNTTNLTNPSNEKPIKLDIIGNVYVPGPQGYADAYAVHSDETPSGSRVYLNDNLSLKLTDLSSRFIAKSRVVGRTQTLHRSERTFHSVLRDAGSRPWDRNTEDSRVVNGVWNGTLRLRNSVGKWPKVTSRYRSLPSLDGTLTLSELDEILPLFER